MLCACVVLYDVCCLSLSLSLCLCLCVSLCEGERWGEGENLEMESKGPTGTVYCTDTVTHCFHYEAYIFPALETIEFVNMK
jgi:hypothetical protein